MTAIEMRMSLLQEIDTILDNEELVKKMLISLRRIKQAAQAKAEADREPTKEEILAGIKAGLQAIKDRREGKDVTGKFRDAREWLNEL